VLTASIDNTARVWNADGSGAPTVLKGHEDRVMSAVFSPDGMRVLTASGDKTARVWANVTRVPSVAQFQAQLWQATRYCIPVRQRQDLLGVDERTAAANLARCHQRVEQAFRARGRDGS
jgi:hypothetical protein